MNAPNPTNRLVLRVAGPDELDVGTLYALLRLRTDIFVVEQTCPYQELDGRDLEPGTRHLWLYPGEETVEETVDETGEEAGKETGERAEQRAGEGAGDGTRGDPTDVHAYLRTLVETDGDTVRIGRVCTAVKSRGAGLSSRLLEAALRIPARAYVLEAQTYLIGFYERYGFVPTGPEYVEDGIPHVPMRLDRGPQPG